MSATIQGPPDAEAPGLPAPGGPVASLEDLDAYGAPTRTLGSLPVGARLILRCRREWRAAAVAARDEELGRVVLSVASPKGGTYRVRRSADTPLALDGSRPVLGAGAWRACFARYDPRW